MSGKKDITSILMIELDCLLDTRLAAIAQMGDESLLNVFKEDYHNRKIDKFKTIDNKKFMEIYNNRDKKLLKDGLVTPFSKFIREFVQRTHENSINTPFEYKPEVLLNVYPYKLTHEEKVVLLSTLKTLTNTAANCEIVELSPEEITPLYLKTNLSILIMYRYDQWIGIHHENGNFKKHTAPDVTVIGPRIYFKDIDGNPTQDPFEAMQQVIGPFVNLVLMPIEHFSSVLNPRSLLNEVREHTERKSDNIEK